MPPPAPQAPPPADAEARREGILSGDSRGIIVGLAATILLHLAILLVVPPTFFSPSGTGLARGMDRVREYDITLVPEEEQPEKQERFVETNPEANANPPDKTENFSSQDQQAAQPVPDRENLEMPKTEGGQEQSDRIVVGMLEEPVPSAAPAPREQPVERPEEPVEPESSRLKVPLPGFEKIEGEAEDGIGATPSSREERPSNDAPLFVAGDVEVSADGRMPRLVPAPAPPSPQPRPHVKQVRPGVLQERPVGVANAGVIGVSARFSEFGDYLQELIETVQVQWDRILMNSQVYPTAGTNVTIRFILNSQGEVQVVEVVDRGASQPAIYACLNSITARQPYRPWTKQMVEVLGNEEEIIFDFYYR